jgi:maltooligosyltrehalose synthase
VQAPTPNEEYLIYQTLAGTFPFDEKPDEFYKQRIRDYLVKALREAKQTSNWDDPDEAHEKAVCDFATSLLNFPGANSWTLLSLFTGNSPGEAL